MQIQAVLIFFPLVFYQNKFALAVLSIEKLKNHDRQYICHRIEGIHIYTSNKVNNKMLNHSTFSSFPSRRTSVMYLGRLVNSFMKSCLHPKE